MADPNFAATAEMLAFAIRVLDELETYTATSGSGLVATTEATRNDLEGDYAQATRAAIDSALASVNSPLTKAGARQLLDPILRQMAVAINYPNPAGDISDIWEAIYDYFVDNSQTLNSPEDTIDTSYSAGGSNVGNGEVVVLTVDENSNTLGWLTDAWTLECVADARTVGRAHQESWDFYGTDRRRDNLAFTGTGLRVRGIRTIAADLSKTYLKNPSWNTYTLSGSSITALDGWTASSGALSSANLTINTTYAARPTPGESTSVSLQFTGNDTVYQDLVVTGGARINPDLPFIIDVAVAKVGTPTGTATIRLSGTVGSGGVSASLAHGSMTGSGTFDRLRIAIGANCWPKNFNANDLKIQISFASTGSIDASNYFLVDDLCFTPLTRVGRYGDPRSGRGSMGIYLGVMGGSTPFVLGDVFTASDSLGGTRGVNDWGLTKIAQYGRLPFTTGGTETVADK